MKERVDLDIASIGSSHQDDVMITEIREARALIAAIKAEGCPVKWLDGVPFCVWCETVMEDQPIEHKEMDDGEPCLWVRIEQA